MGRGGRRRRAWIAAAVVFLTLVALELGFRALEGPLGIRSAHVTRFQEFVWSGRHSWYEPRAFVGYVGRVGLKPINSLGFSVPEPEPTKTPGVLRVACLGGSTTQGGNTDGPQGSFPWILEELAAERGLELEVLNFGMSGWTSAETLVNYFLNVQALEPDVVVLHHAVNDVEARIWPGFRNDYSHYRRPWQDLEFPLWKRALVRSSRLFAHLWLLRAQDVRVTDFVNQPIRAPLALEGGAPRPATGVAFRSNVRSIGESVELRGGRFAVMTMPYAPAAWHRDDSVDGPYCRGTDMNNAILRELAAEHGWTLVDADEWFREHRERTEPCFLDLVHLTTAGNRFKAELLLDALFREDSLPR